MGKEVLERSKVSGRRPNSGFEFHETIASQVMPLVAQRVPSFAFSLKESRLFSRIAGRFAFKEGSDLGSDSTPGGVSRSGTAGKRKVHHFARHKKGKSKRKMSLSDVVAIFIGGAAGGAAAISFIHPLDTVKTILQGGAAQQSMTAGSLAVHLLRTKGPFVFYTGLAGAAAGAAGTAAIKISTFHTINHFGRDVVSRTFEPVVPFIAGAVGGLAGCICDVPSEVIKQRLQTGMYPNLRTAITAIFRTEGLKGFYTGFLPTACRDVPYTFVEFPIYAAFTKWWQQWRGTEGDKLDKWEGYFLGGVAGSLAHAVTTPSDVVKTKVMVKAAADVQSAINDTYRQEGVGGFFRGVGVRVLIGLPCSAIFFGVFENVKHLVKSGQHHLAGNTGPPPKSSESDSMEPH